MLISGSNVSEDEVFFLESSTSCSLMGLFRPVQGLLYLTFLCNSIPILNTSMAAKVLLPIALI